MKHLSTIMIAGMAVAFAATALTPAGFAQDAMAAWKARSDLMKANIGAYQRIAKSDNAKAAVDDAKLLQANIEKIPSLFGPGTDHPDDRAKPEIWQNMADFRAKAAAASKAAQNVVAAAEKGDLEATKAAAKGVLDACNVCHDAYRGPAKAK